MRNWEQIVRERLQESGTDIECTDSIVPELASHLEEIYEAIIGRGLTQQAASEIIRQEVHDWRALARQIQRARSKEDLMNQRTRAFWLPSAASILGASLAMTLLQRLGVRPCLLWTGPVAMSFYLPWLAVLPVFGGLGAYLSQRTGGSIRSRITAALAPVLWLLISVLIEPVEIARSGFPHLFYFGYGMTNWVAIPGVVLVLGAAPFLRKSPESTVRSPQA